MGHGIWNMERRTLDFRHQKSDIRHQTSNSHTKNRTKKIRQQIHKTMGKKSSKNLTTNRAKISDKKGTQKLGKKSDKK